MPLEIGDVLIAIGTEPELQALEDMFAPESPLAAGYAVDRLATAVGAIAGREVALDRPKDASLGDYATNVALQSAKELGRPPREIAEELVAKLVELPRSRPRTWRGRGS